LSQVRQAHGAVADHSATGPLSAWLRRRVTFINCRAARQGLGTLPSSPSTGMPDLLKTSDGAALSRLLGLDSATRCARLTASPLVNSRCIG